MKCTKPANTNLNHNDVNLSNAGFGIYENENPVLLNKSEFAKNYSSMGNNDIPKRLFYDYHYFQESEKMTTERIMSKINDLGSDLERYKSMSIKVMKPGRHYVEGGWTEKG